MCQKLSERFFLLPKNITPRKIQRKILRHLIDYVYRTYSVCPLVERKKIIMLVSPGSALLVRASVYIAEVHASMDAIYRQTVTHKALLV